MHYMKELHLVLKIDEDYNNCLFIEEDSVSTQIAVTGSEIGIDNGDGSLVEIFENHQD